MVEDSFLFWFLVFILDLFPDLESKGQINEIWTKVFFLSLLSDLFLENV